MTMRGRVHDLALGGCDEAKRVYSIEFERRRAEETSNVWMEDEEVTSLNAADGQSNLSSLTLSSVDLVLF